MCTNSPVTFGSLFTARQTTNSAGCFTGSYTRNLPLGALIFSPLKVNKASLCCSPSPNLQDVTTWLKTDLCGGDLEERELPAGALGYLLPWIAVTQEEIPGQSKLQLAVLAGRASRSLLAQPGCELCKSCAVYKQQAAGDVKLSICLSVLAGVTGALPVALD